MCIDDYKRASEKILSLLPSNESYELYKRLMEIFVQDCALNIHQPFFGNITKQKAKILFYLQKQFLNFHE